jgi:hypothetical protein
LGSKQKKQDYLNMILTCKFELAIFGVKSFLSLSDATGTVYGIARPGLIADFQLELEGAIQSATGEIGAGLAQ